MAQIEIPTLVEIYENPKLLLQLPQPIAEKILEYFRHIEQVTVGANALPSTPVEMAVRHPRWRWMDARHIHFMGDEVARTVDANEGLIVTVPPQHAKTHTCSVWTPFWKLARDPEANILIISSTLGIARKWGVKVQGLVQTYGSDYNLSLNPKKTAGDDWELSTGGNVSSVGVGGVISGRYLKLVIIDDAIKDFRDAHSETVRETTWEWWEGTVIQRLQPDTALIVVGTRYREDDLIGRMIQQSLAGTGPKFRVIRLPAIAEEDDPLGRAPGEGLWSDKGQQFYEQKRANTSPYVWASEYQQEPSPPGGNLVDPDWWQYYQESQLPEKFDQEIQTWDLALDGKKKSDSYHCGGLMSRKGAKVYLRDAFHEHCDINKVIETIRRWNHFYPGAKTKLIERAVGGPTLAESLRHQVSGIIPWPPKGRQKDSKEACLQAIIPDIRSGNVLLPLLPNGEKPRWVLELIEEMRKFPRGAHDDYVDMCSQGVSFLLPSAHRESRRAEERRKLAALAGGEVPPQQAHTQMLHKIIERVGRPHMDAIRAQLEQEADNPVAPRADTSNDAESRFDFSADHRGMW